MLFEYFRAISGAGGAQLLNHDRADQIADIGCLRRRSAGTAGCANARQNGITSANHIDRTVQLNPRKMGETLRSAYAEAPPTEGKIDRGALSFV